MSETSLIKIIQIHSREVIAFTILSTVLLGATLLT